MNFITPKGRVKNLTNTQKYAINWSSGSRSKLQKRVKDLLYLLWRGHVVYEEFPVAGTRSTLDFYNSTLKIAIEVQGNQHTRHIAHFHGPKMLKFIDQLKRDVEKADFCDKNSIKLVEVMEGEDITLELLKQRIHGE